ncbi:MAG: ribosome maturation factor RimM [Proteobacteria bacterium]|nr:ribosome maturation factor RimM [Pseudomonadota bacterium]MBU1710999.1 ribosome maturation factor RimM [Pseudomonadota bacterium]
MVTHECELKDLPDFIPYGKIVKAHGIKGEIKVAPYFSYPDDLQLHQEIALVDTEKNRCTLWPVIRSRFQGNNAILKLEGIETRNDAEECRGIELWIDKTLMPRPDDGEYYWHEIEGLMIETDDGIALGKVSDIFSSGAHEVWVVTGKGREYLIPAKKEFIVEKDDQQGKLILTLPPGLLEINES